MRGALSVARHELRHTTRLLDRRSVPVLVAVGILFGLGLPIVLSEGVDPDRGLYPVHADAGPLGQALAVDDRFRTVAGDRADLAAGRIALVVGDDVLYEPEHPRSVAAAEALLEAAEAWNEARLREESDMEAAFPVRVGVYTLQRELIPGGDAGGRPPRGGPGEDEAPADPAPEGGAIAEAADVQGRTDLLPSEIEPPFPIRSLLLTFAYVIPLNFLAQVQSGSLHADRVRRRGLILLSAPMQPGQILLGRVLPYAAASLVVWGIATAVIRTDAWGAMAGLVIIAFVHVASVLIGLLARSEREVTFLLTGVTTAFSTFLFLPAVFTALPPVALLSPVTVVAAGIRGDDISPGGLVYALAPLAVMSATLGALAAALYREETLFAPRTLWAKASDGLDRLLAHRWLLLPAGALVVPWAFTLELFLVAVVIPLGLLAAFPLIVLGAGYIEEALKAWLGVRHRRTHGGHPLLVGALLGLGFYLGEKLAFVLVLVNYGSLPEGEATIALFGLGTALQAVAPLAIHIAGATISCWPAHGKPAARRWAWFAAATLHGAYNVALLAGGLA